MKEALLGGKAAVSAGAAGWVEATLPGAIRSEGRRSPIHLPQLPSQPMYKAPCFRATALFANRLLLAQSPTGTMMALVGASLLSFSKGCLWVGEGRNMDWAGRLEGG